MKTLILLCVTLLAVGGLSAARFDHDELEFLMRKMMIESRKHSSGVESFSIDGVYAENDPSLKSCSCQSDMCGCCVHAEIKEINLNDTVCLNVSYLPKEIGVQVALVLDGKVLFSEKVSAKNPPPICADVPYLKKLASLCLRLYDLDWASGHAGGCADLEAKLVGIVVEKLSLGCFKFPWQNNHTNKLTVR